MHSINIRINMRAQVKVDSYGHIIRLVARGPITRQRYYVDRVCSDANEKDRIKKWLTTRTTPGRDATHRDWMTYGISENMLLSLCLEIEAGENN
jgi:hypothetical protein